VLLKKMNLWETVVTIGVKRKWFDQFLDYWINVLGGLSLNVSDFHQLRFHYRKIAHANTHLKQLSWNNEAEHLHNWQTPDNLYLTFNYVTKCALHPFRSRQLLKVLDKDMRVLEYGCSLAPMYRTYREYLNHIPTQWVLADIPNFPFHYARQVYARDLEVEQFVTITEELFDDPLKNVQRNFDVIIVQEVFEHLHKPLHIAEYLVNRLNDGGLFFFDYAVSDAQGLDTSAALIERQSTLEYLSGKLEVVHGDFQNGEISGRCIGRKRQALHC